MASLLGNSSGYDRFVGYCITLSTVCFLEIATLKGLRGAYNLLLRYFSANDMHFHGLSYCFEWFDLNGIRSGITGTVTHATVLLEMCSTGF